MWCILDCGSVTSGGYQAAPKQKCQQGCLEKWKGAGSNVREAIIYTSCESK